MADQLVQSREVVLAEIREKQANSRELLLAEPQVISHRPREVYKEKNIKRNKDISRSSEETIIPGVSDETQPLARGEASANATLTSSCSLKESINDTSRGHTYSGISIQHVKTSRGVKLGITLQTEAMAHTGKCQLLTAELKRRDRLRELKPYSDDSAQFSRLYSETITEARELGNELLCIGRVHERGKRTAWYPDVMCVARLTPQGTAHSVLLLIGDEEYSIDMDHELSPRQQTLYHSGGFHGKIYSTNSVPRLESAKLSQFGR